MKNTERKFKLSRENIKGHIQKHVIPYMLCAAVVGGITATGGIYAYQGYLNKKYNDAENELSMAEVMQKTAEEEAAKRYDHDEYTKEDVENAKFVKYRDVNGKEDVLLLTTKVNSDGKKVKVYIFGNKKVVYERSDGKIDLALRYYANSLGGYVDSEGSIYKKLVAEYGIKESYTAYEIDRLIKKYRDVLASESKNDQEQNTSVSFSDDASTVKANGETYHIEYIR